MLAVTFPFGPTVRRCSCNSTVPSTSPSMVRSSRLRIWPFTLTDLPSTALPPREVSRCGSLRTGSVDIGIPSLASSDLVGGGADAGLGACSSLRRFHMGAPPFHEINLPGAQNSFPRVSSATQLSDSATRLFTYTTTGLAAQGATATFLRLIGEMRHVIETL